MSEQQSAPEQLAAGKSQGGAGATYKVLGHASVQEMGEKKQSGLIREGSLTGSPTTKSNYWFKKKKS